MEDSKISWTDNTFSPWHGCTKVSPGCDNCYAESLNARWGGNNWGKGNPRKMMSDVQWKKPLNWEKNARETGTITKVFCGSMCDVMDDEAPESQRERLWELIDQTPNLTWQILTKRPHRYVKYLPETGFIHDNVILMATIEKQEFYLPRMKALNQGKQQLEMYNDINRRDFALALKPVRTGISYEPALGPLSIREYPGLRPDWLIFGGETGNNPRPMETAWAANIKAECERFGVAFWMKQMSARTPGKAADLIPAELLLRQFPEVA